MTLRGKARRGILSRSEALLALAGLLASALPARAAVITWPQAANLTLSGSGITLTIDAAAEADSLTINPSSFTVVVASGETFTVRYPGPSYGTMSNDGSIDDCNIVGSDNVSVVSGPKTVTFTPSTATCTPASTGGSGNNVPSSVRLYAPNGGETVAGGSVYKVFWTYTGSQARSVSLAISLDGGAYEAVASGLNHAQGYYDMTMPRPALDASAKMRVQLFGDGGALLASDESDASFVIDVPTSATVPVTPPEEPAPPPTASDVGPLPEPYDPAATIETDKGLPEATTPQAAFCKENELIKLADDGKSSTQHDSAVYYCGKDGKRYVFPSAKVYETWYADFSKVRVVTPEELASLPLGGNVTYRPGARLLKIQSDPKTYAVGRDGLLRHVPDEATAVALFGSFWNAQIDDVDVAFFLNYRIGLPISSAMP